MALISSLSLCFSFINKTHSKALSAYTGPHPPLQQQQLWHKPCTQNMCLDTMRVITLKCKEVHRTKITHKANNDSMDYLHLWVVDWYLGTRIFANNVLFKLNKMWRRGGTSTHLLALWSFLSGNKLLLASEVWCEEPDTDWGITWLSLTIVSGLTVKEPHWATHKLFTLK